MTSTRVRDMTASSALAGTEKFYADNGTTDVYVTSNQIATFIGGREQLTGDRDYYVDVTLGSDSNDGRASGAGGAFETIQKAIDVVCDTLDLQGYDVVINIAAGTYPGEIALRRYVGGTGTPDLLVGYDGGGETQLPYNNANVTLRGVSGTILAGLASPVLNRVLRCDGVTTPWFLDRLEFNPAAASQDAISVSGGSCLLLGEVTFHAPISYCIYITNNSAVIVQEYSDIIFPGGIYGYFVNATRGSIFFMHEHCTIDVQGASDWDANFLGAEFNAQVFLYRMDGFTITGAQTGRRWFTAMGGEITVHFNTGGLQDPNSVLPGNTAGSHVGSWGGINGRQKYMGLNVGTSSSNMPANNALGLDGVTVTSLTSVPYAGQVSYVTDATTTTVATTVVGGSTCKVLVWYNGANWRIFAN
jgi:hypothetical protein